jgi:uncharacterized protein YgbK (DUF1537 family)
MRFGIIADDLTGACDTAAQLTYYDLRVLVTTPDTYDISRNADVLVLNTRSRHQAPDEASERVRQAARRLADLGVTAFYKKIDSTLRGNWIVEVDALMQEAAFDVALIAPAFPRTGRATVGGCQYVDESLLEITAAAQGGLSPMRESDLLGLLRHGTSQPSGLVPLLGVKKGASEIRRQIKSLIRSGARWIVCDAEHESDLEQIAQAGHPLDRSILWVGSAGLARYWPRAAGHVEKAAPARPSWSEPVLVVLGSLHPKSRQQALSLCRAKQMRVIEIDGDNDLSDSRGSIQQAINDLAAGRSVIVATPAERYADTARLREVFAGAASRICRSAPIGTLALIGGDTAEHIGEQLEWLAIEITGEVDAGIPLGKIVGGILDGVPLVTKAGGFGKADALLQLINDG